jgi:hypothetical protein
VQAAAFETWGFCRGEGEGTGHRGNRVIGRAMLCLAVLGYGEALSGPQCDARAVMYFTKPILKMGLRKVQAEVTQAWWGLPAILTQPQASSPGAATWMIRGLLLVVPG